jgi:hypothetical protein
LIFNSVEMTNKNLSTEINLFTMVKWSRAEFQKHFYFGQRTQLGRDFIYCWHCYYFWMLVEPTEAPESLELSLTWHLADSHKILFDQGAAAAAAAAAAADTAAADKAANIAAAHKAATADKAAAAATNMAATAAAAAAANKAAAAAD